MSWFNYFKVEETYVYTRRKTAEKKKPVNRKKPRNISNRVPLKFDAKKKNKGLINNIFAATWKFCTSAVKVTSCIVRRLSDLPKYLVRKMVPQKRSERKIRNRRTSAAKKRPTQKTKRPLIVHGRKKINTKVQRKISSPKLREASYKRQAYVGYVTQYFSKISVAAIKIEQSPVKINDTLIISANGSQIIQKVKSMQMNRENIALAKKGDEIGLKVTNPVPHKGKVYLRKQ